MKKLPNSFYRRDDVLKISRDLLGKVLCTSIDGELTKAIIAETEAYAGIIDKASHAYGNRRTNRTEPMYGEGGHAYVYLCYGIHHLFNVVTNVEGIPHAVLIRAGKPLLGEEAMRVRREQKRKKKREKKGKKKEKRKHTDKSLLAGPGSLSQALGIRTSMTGTDLLGDRIWIEDHDLSVASAEIQTGPRIGVDYAGEDASLPYRFVLQT